MGGTVKHEVKPFQDSLILQRNAASIFERSKPYAIPQNVKH